MAGKTKSVTRASARGSKKYSVTVIWDGEPLEAYSFDTIAQARKLAYNRTYRDDDTEVRIYEIRNGKHILLGQVRQDFGIPIWFGEDGIVRTVSGTGKVSAPVTHFE